jgi:ammonia channel protein AmtB
MSALVEAFREGGIWMYVITAWALAFYALLAHQYVRRHERDFTSVLWGLLLGLVLLGPLGSTVGLYQASVAVDARQGLDAVGAVKIVSTCIGIASLTTIFSTLLAAIGAVALGIVTHGVRRGQPARSGHAQLAAS